MTRPLPLAAALAFTLLALAGWTLASFTLDQDGRLWIEGTSTLHDWTCEVEHYAGVLDLEAEGAGLADLTATTVTVPVQGIDCDNGTMNGKLRDALGRDNVRYVLTGATLGAPDADGWIDVAADGRLTVAGVTRATPLAVRAQALDDGRLRFTGAATVTMSDFGVDPPTALLGTLKTGDEVTVRFDVTASR